VSHSAPRHRKQPHSALANFVEPPRHRRQPEAASRPSWKSGRLAVITGTLAVVGAAAVATAVYLPGNTDHPAAGTAMIGNTPAVADGLGREVANGAGLAFGKAIPSVSASSPASSTASHASSSRASTHASKPASRAAAVSKPAAATPKLANSVYLNPLRSITGLLAERIDMGADYGGSGPIYALGRAVITGATASSPGWPGGGWITYQLTNGPAKGLVVYVAEDVTPTVRTGQHVTSATEIAKMYNGSAGIETGWATSDSSTAESQMPAAGGISGQGPFPTAVGMNFENLLVTLGVPRSPFNGSASTFGVVPSNYPTNWLKALTSKSK